MQEQVVVITGASGGIGAAVAEGAAARGASVVLVARRAEALQAVATRCGGRALVIPADVTRRDEVRRIVAENASCVMLKHEDWPGLDKISALRGYEQDGSMRRISILCGNGGLFLDFEMARGADGANTGYCFPDMLCDVVRLSQAGRRDEAQDLFDAHLPLLRYEQQPGVGLAVRKYVLWRRGLLSSMAQRLPSTPWSPKAQAEVEWLLQRLSRHDARARVLA